MKEFGNKDCMHVSFRIANRPQSPGKPPTLVVRELFTEALTRQDETAGQLAKLNSRLRKLSVRLRQLDTIQRHLERGIFMLFQDAGRLDARQATAAIERCCSKQPPSHTETEYVVLEEDGVRG